MNCFEDVGKSIAELTDAEIDAALERGRVARLTEPCAVAVRYDRIASRITVDLSKGCTFIFPPRSLQGLATATDDEIAAVEILGCGFGLHWNASPPGVR